MYKTFLRFNRVFILVAFFCVFNLFYILWTFLLQETLQMQGTARRATNTKYCAWKGLQ